ncbi:hypothetical protein LZD49_01780 [Dyadobacter sp. CY261]|uniref:hypothetical protein n=1 Tax=Dyadobacter sp. CY261 TaxID=2907203 RepID=UPI001F1EF57C|nr:hypothetical protein [Dyadobacter sp. CY261]MCF0069182.1 hypothetical protein [Dyadobacter sp. CY261]
MTRKLISLLIGIVLLNGCKKDDAEPVETLTARVAGKTWTANISNNQNTTVGAAIVQGMVAVVALQDADNAKTAFGIQFPENIKVGEEVEIDRAEGIVIAYAISNSEGYVIDPAKGGSGRLKVMLFDRENKIVEGSFTGEGVHNQNGSKVGISNGYFRSRIFDTQVVTTSPGKK